MEMQNNDKNKSASKSGALLNFVKKDNRGLSESYSDINKQVLNDNNNKQVLNSMFYGSVSNATDKLQYSFSDLGITPKEADSYYEYDLAVNPHTSIEELNRLRGERQSVLEQAGNSIVQAVGNEVLIGTVLGVSNLIDSAVNLVNNSEYNDYTNPVSEYLEGLKEEIKDRFTIYRKDPNASWAISDFGWWADNAVSVASTASMLIPSTGIARGLGILGKIGNFSSKASRGLAKATKAITGASTVSTARLAKSIRNATEIGVTAGLSRTMEGYLEAREVFKETKDNTLKRIQEMSTEEKERMIKNNPQLANKTDEEMANYIAGESADETFRNDYAMLLMDIAQFKAIGSLWKGMRNKSAGRKLINENRKAIKSLVGETLDDTAETATKSSWLSNRLTKIKDSFNNPLTAAAAIEWSEGIEEGFQGIQVEKGKEVAEMILDPTFTPRTIESYLKDEKIWEQAFWGVLGGMGFQVAGKALGNAYRKIDAWQKHRKGKLSDEDFAANMSSEEKIRSIEINNRAAKTRKFVEDMILLNDYKNPYTYKKHPVTGEIIYEDGVEQYQSMTPEEAELMKADVVTEYITSMVMDASDVGNYDLLREYISSNEFNKYFEEAGINTETSDKKFNQRLLDIADNVADIYETNLYNVLRNVDTENESTIKAIAREFTRERLTVDSITENIDTIQEKIDKLNTAEQNVISDYSKNSAIKYIKEELKEINKRQNDLFEDKQHNQISEQAYAQYKKDYDDYRTSLLNLLRNEFSITSESDINNYEAINEILDKNKDNTDIDYIMSVIDNIDISLKETPTKAISELIDKQIRLKSKRNYIETILPNTQEDYITRSDEIAQQIDAIAIKRLNDAAKKVEEYIIKQEDLNKATEDVLKGNVPELKNELDILKIGYYTTENYTKTILATVKEEQAKRNKEENDKKKVKINSNVHEGPIVEKVKENIKDTNNAAETNTAQKDTKQTKDSQSDVKVSPSTGNNQKSDEDIMKSYGEAVSKASHINQDIDDLAKASRDTVKIVEMQNDYDPLGIATGMANTITLSVYGKFPNLFEEAIGKEVNSPEVQNLINTIINELIDKDISIEIAPVAAKKGLIMFLNYLNRRAKRTNNESADKFKELADTIALKHDLSKDMSSSNTTLSDLELDKVINDLLETYKTYKNISTPENQKTIINLERLFHDIIYDENINIDIDTAMHILWNMKDYINSDLNTKYIFTHKRDLNSILKNPAEFFNAIVNARSKQEQLDNYMHINAPTNKDDDYGKLISSLTNGENITVEYIEDRYGRKHSISFKVNNKEIGFISTVTPNTTNTEYQVYISDYSGGIAYKITKNEGDTYTSNTDDLFTAVFDSNDILWSIINKRYRRTINLNNKDITDTEVEKFMTHPAIKNAIQDGVIKLPKKYNERTKQVELRYKKESDQAKFIIHKLIGVIFYDVSAQSSIEYIDSYEQWKKNAYTNYKNTHKIQTALNKNSKIVTKFVNAANTYGKGSEDIKSIINEEESNISELGLTFDRNPIVGVVNQDGNAMLINEKTGKTMMSSAPFQIGSMGMLIGGRENTPILALFSSANKLQDKIKQQLKDELTDILVGFQENRYTYEEVDKKLSSLFNGPGIGTPTIFQGYSVISSTSDKGSSIGLSINGDVSKYALIINKFKKDSNELGTGITYAPNGDKNKALSSVSVNRKFIAKIVNEIVDNVTYNKTFYTLNNIGKDKTTDNPYMYKEGGKFIINLGGVKTEYENFGDFVLRENAFNTYQGRNEYNGYFDVSDKVNSLYVDISLMNKPDSVTSPVEGEYTSIADTIKTATKDKFNSTKELLEKASFPKEEIDFLTGNNDLNLSLVPEEYGYDKSLTKEDAVYRNGKMLFSTTGANTANESAFKLKRLFIHERLHDEINKQKLFDRELIVDELLDTYNATLEAIENIIQTANAESAEFKNAVNVRNWLKDNKFNPTDYFTKFNTEKNAQYANMSQEQRDRIFAEEWLVETMTQPLIMNFLNNVEYRGQEVNVEGIKNESKSIWQKIIDLLLKLFGKGNKNVKNNTIFAKQYLIFSNSNPVINSELTETTEELETTEEIESIEEEQDTVDDSNEDTEEDDSDTTTTSIEEDEESEDTEENKEINLDREAKIKEERLSTTTNAESYIEYTEEEQEILRNAPKNAKGKLLVYPNGPISNLNEKQYAQVRTKAFIRWFGDWTNDPENASKVTDENGEPLVVYHGTNKKFDIFTEQLNGIYFTTDTEYAKNISLSKGAISPIIIPAFLNIKNLVIGDMVDDLRNTLDLDYDTVDAFNVSERTGKIKFGYRNIKRLREKNALHNFDGVIGSDYSGGFASYKEITKEEYDNFDEERDGYFGEIKVKILNNKYYLIDKYGAISKGEEYVVFNSNQVKSATGNNGEFSLTDDNIYHSANTNAEEYIIDDLDNDGKTTAKTFGITQITNMSDYLNMFPKQDKLLIAKMIANNEIKYACR